jgi:hypothetical protein
LLEGGFVIAYFYAGFCKLELEVELVDEEIDEVGMLLELVEVI